MQTFKQFVNEMTMKTGKNGMANFDPKQTIEYLEKYGTVIGHMERKEIVFAKFNKLFLYGIKNDEKVTTILAGEETKILDQEYLQIVILYTDETYRNKSDAKRLYFFIKHQESKKILGGDKQSDQAIHFLDSLAKSHRFEMHWLNIKTGEKEKYEPGEDAKYRNFKYTDWRVLIEGDMDRHPMMKLERWYDKNDMLGLSQIWTLFEKE
jgi:hypothetical protein